MIRCRLSPSTALYVRTATVTWDVVETPSEAPGVFRRARPAPIASFSRSRGSGVVSAPVPGVPPGIPASVGGTGGTVAVFPGGTTTTPSVTGGTITSDAVRAGGVTCPTPG